jgi:hypothetical protein
MSDYVLHTGECEMTDDDVGAQRALSRQSAKAAGVGGLGELRATLT